VCHTLAGYYNKTKKFKTERRHYHYSEEIYQNTYIQYITFNFCATENTKYIKYAINLANGRTGQQLLFLPTTN
jgi:hypothetical protein